MSSVTCSNVNLLLEQLCLEGTRKQAKYAVSAIAAMTADSGLKALSVLYGVSFLFLFNTVAFLCFSLFTHQYCSVELVSICGTELVFFLLFKIYGLADVCGRDWWIS